jgi:hypothetical protein
VSICSYSSANSGFDDADFRALDCQSSGRQAALKSPLNRFPPSRGIIFRRTPPADVSADAARLVADLLAHGVV